MKTSWYREPWAWFIFFFPTLAVTGGIATYIIFNNNAPTMVSDDYYKDGKKINLDLSKYNEARDRNIAFNLDFADKVATFSLFSGDMPKNQAIKISFFHVTLAKYDLEQLATASADGKYRISLPDDMIDGKWRVRIESFDNVWRVQEYVAFPSDVTIQLDGEQD